LETSVRTNRQDRAEKTRRRLFRAACELFASFGYSNTTVDTIARRAKVAKGTFFVHYATKDAVIKELMLHQIEKAAQARSAALAAGTSLDALRATVLTLGAEAGRSRELSRAVLAAGLENPLVGDEADALFSGLFECMKADARAAVGGGLLSRASDPVGVASALMASYLGATLHFASSPRSQPLERILQPLVDANLAGFSYVAKETDHAQQPRSRARLRHRVRTPSSTRRERA
jgi:AcrR family transcriptional regulator